MSDDIREVMRPTPWSPLKRVGRAGGRNQGGARHSEGEEGESEEEREGLSQGDIEKLRGEVEAANERLKAAGRRIEIGIVADGGAPLIEITLPGAAGGAHHKHRISPEELPRWVDRLESGEGLIIDERL